MGTIASGGFNPAKTKTQDLTGSMQMQSLANKMGGDKVNALGQMLEGISNASKANNTNKLNQFLSDYGGLSAEETRAGASKFGTVNEQAEKALHRNVESKSLGEKRQHQENLQEASQVFRAGETDRRNQFAVDASKSAQENAMDLFGKQVEANADTAKQKNLYDMARDKAKIDNTPRVATAEDKKQAVKKEHGQIVETILSMPIKDQANAVASAKAQGVDVSMLPSERNKKEIKELTGGDTEKYKADMMEKVSKELYSINNNIFKRNPSSQTKKYVDGEVSRLLETPEGRIRLETDGASAVMDSLSENNIVQENKMNLNPWGGQFAFLGNQNLRQMTDAEIKIKNAEDLKRKLQKQER